MLTIYLKKMFSCNIFNYCLIFVNLNEKIGIFLAKYNRIFLFQVFYKFSTLCLNVLAFPFVITRSPIVSFFLTKYVFVKDVLSMCKTNFCSFVIFWHWLIFVLGGAVIKAPMILSGILILIPVLSLVFCCCNCECSWWIHF